MKNKLESLIARRDQIKAALAECGGEAYRGCWLDSATNGTGKRYTRLRWFRDAPGKKGCRILRGEELAIAARAIALWKELERIEAVLKRLDQESP